MFAKVTDVQPRLGNRIQEEKKRGFVTPILQVRDIEAPLKVIQGDLNPALSDPKALTLLWACRSAVRGLAGLAGLSR